MCTLPILLFPCSSLMSPFLHAPCICFPNNFPSPYKLPCVYLWISTASVNYLCSATPFVSLAPRGTFTNLNDSLLKFMLNNFPFVNIWGPILKYNKWFMKSKLMSEVKISMIFDDLMRKQKIFKEGLPMADKRKGPKLAISFTNVHLSCNLLLSSSASFLSFVGSVWTARLAKGFEI